MLELNHKKLDVYKVALLFVSEVYQVTGRFPPAEKFGLVQQMRRAAVSVLSNIAEGCSRKSIAERKRFFEISRGSLIEIDAQTEISIMQHFLSVSDKEVIDQFILRLFQMLSKMTS